MIPQQLREERGLNKNQLCRQIGGQMHYGVYSELEKGTRSPFHNTRVNGRTAPNKWSQWANLLAEFYGLPEEYLFPDHAREFSTDPDDLFALLDSQEQYPSPQRHHEYRELHHATREMLNTLTPREEKVLRMRFGIGEANDHTLEEVAADFGVQKERIRQIEAKALRKLRHPSRSKHLVIFVTEDPPDKKVIHYCHECGEYRNRDDEFCQGDHCWTQDEPPTPRSSIYEWQRFRELQVKRFGWYRKCLMQLEDRRKTPWRLLPNWCPEVLPKGIEEDYKKFTDGLKKERAEERKREKEREKQAREWELQWKARLKEREELEYAQKTFSEYFVVFSDDGELQVRMQVSPMWIEAMEKGYLTMTVLGEKVTTVPKLEIDDVETETLRRRAR